MPPRGSGRPSVVRASARMASRVMSVRSCAGCVVRIRRCAWSEILKKAAAFSPGNRGRREAQHAARSSNASRAGTTRGAGTPRSAISPRSSSSDSKTELAQPALRGPTPANCQLACESLIRGLVSARTGSCERPGSAILDRDLRVNRPSCATSHRRSRDPPRSDAATCSRCGRARSPHA
jgi:hypothetical protein